MGELYDIFELVVRTLNNGICRCLAACLAPTYNYYSKLAPMIRNERVRFNVSTTMLKMDSIFYALDLFSN